MILHTLLDDINVHIQPPSNKWVKHFLAKNQTIYSLPSLLVA